MTSKTQIKGMQPVALHALLRHELKQHGLSIGDISDERFPTDREVKVTRPDGTTVALFMMRASRISSWRVDLCRVGTVRVTSPAYEPRHPIDQRSHRHNPAEPMYWGSTTFKTVESVVKAILKADKAYPTGRDQELADARRAHSEALSELHYHRKTGMPHLSPDFLRALLDCAEGELSDDHARAAGSLKSWLDKDRQLKEKVDGLMYAVNECDRRAREERAA